MNKYKIAFVIVYLGKIPPYFNVWLKSCSYNQNYTFLFFTDQDLCGIVLPNNVKAHNISLKDINSKLYKIFNQNYHIKQNYKLCDLRPLYGELFAEELINFDFWGHCDVDLVFGNISNFITNKILDNYDKILTLGHFTLYRNCKKINSIYRTLDKRERYKEVLTTDKNCFFDEGIFNQIIPLYRQKKLFPVWLYDDRYNINSIFADNGFSYYVNFDIIADINYFEDNLQLTWGSCIDYNDRHSHHSVFIWDNGRIVRKYLEKGIIKEEEFMYIHLQKRAMAIHVDVNQSSSFLILKHSFENYTEITKDFLLASNINKRNFKAHKDHVIRFIKHNGHRLKMILKRKNLL